MSTLPKLEGVNESTIKEFLAATAGKIVESSGRCIRVFVAGPRPNWLELTERLSGTGFVCDEFRVQGNHINARLKTDAQLAADELAAAIDDKFGLAIPTAPPCDEQSEQPARNARQLGQANRKTERRVPDGLAQDIMKVMKLECATGTMDTDELVHRVKKRVPKKVDSEGRDRRERNILIAIDKLVSLEFLHVHGEDQDEVSLTNLIKESDDKDPDA